MPCNTVTKVSHDVGKWNEERAREAIKNAGLSGVVSYENGQLVSYSTGITKQDEARITAVKKEYSALTVKAAALKFGFKVSGETKGVLRQIHLKR